MIAFLSPSSAWARAALATGLDVAMRATALLLIALMLHGLLGRRTLVRSMLWNAGLVGLLLLPVVTAALPRVPLALGPAEAPPGPVLKVDERPIPAIPGVSLPSDAATIAIERPTDVVPPAPSQRVDWGVVVLVGYGIGAGLLLARLVRGLVQIAALRRSGRDVDDGSWVEALGRWTGELGLRRPVRLARSGGVGVPVVVGWRRPTILIPEGLVGAAGPRAIDAVLLHELAHVRRGDYAWNLLLRLVQALYWPHPLVWVAGRIVAGVRERACDELCVFWMGGDRAYGATLLDLAAGLLRRPWEALGLAMARPSRLGRRLARIERSRGAARCLLRGPARAAILGAVLAAVALLGSIRLARPVFAAPAPDDPESRAQREAPPDDPKPPAPGEAAPPAPAAVGQPGGPREVRTATVRRGTLRVTTTQPGTLAAFESVDVYAKVPGTVSRLAVDIGDRVRKGQLLAEIDAPELRTDVTRAEIGVKVAQARMQRAVAAVNVARAAVEAEQSRVVKAQADLGGAEAQLKFRQMELDRITGLAASRSIERRLVDEESGRFSAAQAAIAAAKASLQVAENGTEKGKAELAEKTADLETVKLDVQLAEADRGRARLWLDATRILAPFDGVVTVRSVNRGDFVGPPAGGNPRPLATIAVSERLRVIVRVPDRDVPLLDVGDPATLRLDAFPGRTFEGTVSRTAFELDPKDRTLRAEIDLPNPDGRLRPGQFGAVAIILQERPDAVTMPGAALSDLDASGRAACYRVVNGRAVKTPIKLGRQEGSQLEILEGLKEGDVVIVNQGRGLRYADGQPVTAIPAEEDQPGPGGH